MSNTYFPCRRQSLENWIPERVSLIQRDKQNHQNYTKCSQKAKEQITNNEIQFDPEEHKSFSQRLIYGSLL